MSPLTQVVTTLLKQFIWNSIMKQRRAEIGEEEEKHSPELAHLLLPSASLATLADFFRVRIIVICKSSS